MGKALTVGKWALREFLGPLVAVWAVFGGRERRRKRLEDRIITAMLDGMTKNEPMPHLQIKEKDPRC